MKKMLAISGGLEYRAFVGKEKETLMEYSYLLKLALLHCSQCGVPFGITEEYEQSHRSNHASFMCPNGHSQYFPHKTEAERLKLELEKEKRDAASLRENMVAAQRARDKAERRITQLKKRSAAGVCPCCNRTFAQLAAHMETKHKEFQQLQGIGPKKELEAKNDIVQ